MLVGFCVILLEQVSWLMNKRQNSFALISVRAIHVARFQTAIRDHGGLDLLDFSSWAEKH